MCQKGLPPPPGGGGNGESFEWSSTYCANELHLNSGVLEALAILWPHGDGALDRFPVHVQGCLLAPVLVELDVDHGTVVGVLEDDVNVDGGRKEVRHVAGAPRARQFGGRGRVGTGMTKRALFFSGKGNQSFVRRLAIDVPCRGLFGQIKGEARRVFLGRLC